MIVNIKLNGEELTIEGKYYKGYPGEIYKRSGDPGDPSESPSFEIEKIEWKDWNVTELISILGADEKIETIVIEEINDRESDDRI